MSLHALWDQLLGVDQSYGRVIALADKLARASHLQRAAIKERRRHRTLASWVRESQRIAPDFAYAPDRIQFVPAEAVESGEVVSAAIPAVTTDYLMRHEKSRAAGWCWPPCAWPTRCRNDGKARAAKET